MRLRSAVAAAAFVVLVGQFADVQAVVLSIQGPSSPSADTTWVDLHGLGDGNPPQYILNVTDMGQILKAFAGDAWTDDPGNMNPGQCQ